MDALTTRALELAGPAPADGLVWVAVGSQARRELTPASIPRGAVVASRPVPQDWLRSVGSVLAACGLPGDPVARSPAEWASTDGSDELELSVLIERRALWGIPIDPLPVVRDAARQSIVDALARRALGSMPPTGFDGDAVLEADGTRSARLDIRRAAIAPIVELARWGSAAAGIVADWGALRDDDARTLIDAFELGLELRVTHHMERLSEGYPPEDQLDCAQISPLLRDHLRDVFRAVTSVQRRLAA
jgi:CBS domain-containing protein